MTKTEAIKLLEDLETAMSNGRVMIKTIKPIDDFAEEPRETYEDGKHDGYLCGLYDGVEASMGMVEHFQDLINLGIIKLEE